MPMQPVASFLSLISPSENTVQLLYGAMTLCVWHIMCF